MSFVKDFFLGTKGTPATVQDVSTPMEQYLHEQTAQMYNGMLQNPGSIPGYSGPFAAPLSGAESNNLSMLQQFLTGGASRNVTNANATVNNMVTGNAAFSPLVRNPGLSAAGMGLADSILNGRTMDPAQDAILQRAIATAQRPITERFADDLAKTRSSFAVAGQQLGPKASSPFELANAKLQTGLANALGDVSTNIAFGNMMNERNRQDMLLGRQADSVESGLNRQLTAANSVVPNARGVIDGIGEAMKTLALPRLIEQAGIEGGVNEFNTQRDAFMNMLAQAFAGSKATPVTIPGTEGSSGFLGAVLPAVAGAFGGPLGAAAAAAVLNKTKK